MLSVVTWFVLCLGEEVLSSESETEVVIRTRNTEVSDLADTLVK